MESINTCDQKKVTKMKKVTGNRRFNIQRLIHKYNVEISNEESFFWSSDRYKMKKRGETNVFEGVIQGTLYEVFTVVDMKKDEIFEAWRSIKKEPSGHKWFVGKGNLGDVYDK